MSGDVQPRKRKDKKRKKDELGVEEHRGTAAVFGEGDVLMHSQQDHGTGGHWCAKIIFFSLLAILVTLIGLIILENRGLSELEANSVETRYSGVLDGWTEDIPEDDHHDEHTLELKHHERDDEHVLENEFESHDDEISDHDDDEEDNGHDEVGDDEDDEDENDEDEDDADDDDTDDDDDDDEVDEDQQADQDDNDNDEDEDGETEEQNIDYIEATKAKYVNDGDDDDNDGDDDNEDEENNSNDLEDENDTREDADDNEDNDDNNEDNDEDNDDNDIDNEILNDDDDDENDDQSLENDNENEDDYETKEPQDDEDDEEHEEDHDEETNEEIEKIEQEVSDHEEPVSVEALTEASFEKDDDASEEAMNSDEEDEVDERDFLEADDLDEPAVERIAPPPPGKPYIEIEDEVSTETPPDTLAEEEEYEKQQEQLRQEEEAQSSQMWLKLAVGGALLAATHAVIRRATAPRDTPENEQEENASREETPLTDRRMTLLLEEEPKIIPSQKVQPGIEEEIVHKSLSLAKAVPVLKQESEEVEDDMQIDEELEEDLEVQETKQDDHGKELYSDEDEKEAEEEVDEEEELEEKVELPKPVKKLAEMKKKESEPEHVPEDVEIIDEDLIEEEVEEEVEDEEEISDVDDEELLSRLEAKYGRLPEPERPGQRHKDGGNSVEDDWPGEPSDAFWREQLDKAEQDLRQGAFGACEERVSATQLAGSGRALWLLARARDMAAETRRDNRELARAIAAYLQLLKMNERLSDEKLLEVALRTVDRIKFRGTYLNAEPVYRLLIRRFPNNVTYRNNLTISFLMANRADLASETLEETLRLWPNDRVALAHYGFILKTEHNKLEEAVTYFQKALAGDAGPANEPRFYYHLGDALLMLGRTDEAHAVHERGAALGHFLSPAQRSLYNVRGLESRPWWDVESTPYAKLARELELSWRDILKEGEAARALYEKEKEGLRERGDWSQLDVMVRGREVPGRCERAPVTCRIVRTEPAARCRRGQVKFSLLTGGSHVRAHVGPTNCRLRMHLALSNTEHTYIRVDQEIRQWKLGKVLMFDDSFEHEVWHNGTRPRLVLIVDVWHPDLPHHLRSSLPAI